MSNWDVGKSVGDSIRKIVDDPACGVVALKVECSLERFLRRDVGEDVGQFVFGPCPRAWLSMGEMNREQLKHAGWSKL